jgi:N-dimethylarginine dimethylaminohydrolase
MNLNIKDETSTLKTVVLGQPASLGSVPTLRETFDARSYESVSMGIYPTEEEVKKEIDAFEEILVRYNVQVFRPETLENCNQIFARDVAIVIDDKIINSNIIPDREDEKEAYKNIYNQIAFNKIYNLPEKAHFEGGDIILKGNTVFVGIYTAADYSHTKTARTNLYALHFLRELFPEKNFVPLELCKHDTDPRKGVLHLDCTFMTVGYNKAIIYKDGFAKKDDYQMLIEIFGRQNVFEIDTEEMYRMNTNVFSISPSVVVSEATFTRLNRHMETEWGLTVEKIPYQEIAKMGGLLRCSTLPLIRE